MRNGIEAMITDITATTAEAEDYTGEDGLLYCGKCRCGSGHLAFLHHSPCPWI